MRFYLTVVTAGPLLFLATSAFVLGRAPATALPVADSPTSPHSPGAAARGGARSLLKAAADHGIASCGSNATHIGWIGDDGEVSHQPRDEARARMMAYLWTNVMPYDVPNARTLGFDSSRILPQSSDGEGTENHGYHSSSISREMREQVAVDGLSDGIINQTLHYALQAKALYPWTDVIPRSMYMEYVVPYAVVNEPRSDHRPLLFHALRDTLREYERSNHAQTHTIQTQIKQVVKLGNSRLWAVLGRDSSTPIVFRAGLTPRIYDPLSVIAYGHSSCTGLAILLIAALRSVGIPSRMAGTPAWHGNEEDGNHSWVEVFVPGVVDGEEGGRWVFLEPSPGIAEGEEDAANSDDLERDPCERWFCDATRFDGATRVFATRYSRSDTHYPMAWALGDKGVPGEDRTSYYTETCGNCDH